MISALYSVLEDHYRVGRIQSASPLTGGEWNRVFRINSENGIFVLRISHPSNTVASLLYEHRFLHFIHQQIDEVPAPVRTREGETYLEHNGLLMTLFPYMAGRMLDVDNETECLMAAQMFARLQQAGLDYPDLAPRPNKPRFCELDWENNQWWQWQQVKDFMHHKADAFLNTVDQPDKRAIAQHILDQSAFIARERERLRDWVLALKRSERSPLLGVTHCDYWGNNILVEGGRIIAVVDWDGCKAEWLFYPLGRAVWDFCKNSLQHCLNMPKTVNFLNAYQAAGGPVPAAEFDLLVPVMRCVCLIEVLIGLQNAAEFGLAAEAGLNNHVLHRLLALHHLHNLEL